MLLSHKLLRIEQTASDGVRDLLLHNVIGTPGRSMVYRHCKTEEKLRHISRPFFVSLVRREVVLGTCCFCERPLDGISTFYVRYFSFRNALRKAAGIIRAGSGRESVIRDAIHDLFSGRLFSDAGGSIFYAYLDPGNLRSVRLAAEFGFKKAGSFSSIVFSRLWPMLANEAQRLEEEDWTSFKNVLSGFYAAHNFFTAENLWFQGNYFVLKDKGKIVAGLQANPERWEVLEMPGFGGKILMKFFPRVKLLRKLFQPDFRFVSVEGLYYLPGYEGRMQQLLEHVLATFGINSAVLCLDIRSAEYKMLKKLNLGLISHIRKEKLMDVMVKENGFAKIKSDAPCYVSAFDVS